MAHTRTDDSAASRHSERIGLMAGWGRLPIVVAQAMKAQSFEVCCLGIKGHADGPALAAICDDYREIGIAKLGRAIRYFQQHRITRASMAGKIHKVLMFQRFAWLKHLPDWRCIRTFYPHFVTLSKNRNDDALLLAVVDAFAECGIHFAPPTDFAPELLVKYGTVAGRALSRAQQKDVEFGWNLAKEMGRLDVGQSVAVKGRAVLAVEAVEGTDACIRRAGELCRSGSFTVVKVAKPQQDMRFDVPTIGIGTLNTMAEAGAGVLVLEADRTIVLDHEELDQFARQHGISIVALRDADALPGADEASGPPSPSASADSQAA